MCGCGNTKDCRATRCDCSCHGGVYTLDAATAESRVGRTLTAADVESGAAVRIVVEAVVRDVSMEGGLHLVRARPAYGSGTETFYVPPAETVSIEQLPTDPYEVGREYVCTWPNGCVDVAVFLGVPGWEPVDGGGTRFEADTYAIVRGPIPTDLTVVRARS